MVHVHVFYLSKTRTIWAVGAKQFMVMIYCVVQKWNNLYQRTQAIEKIIDAEYHSVVFYHTKSKYNATSGF